MLSDSPQPSDASVNAMVDQRKTFRQPYRWLNLPLTGSISTNPKEYAVIVHPAQLIVVCSPCCSACKAVATIVASTEVIASAKATIVKITTRLTGGFPPACSASS